MISVLDEVEWSASRPSRFTPGETVPGTHWLGVWVGDIVGLDAVKGSKIKCMHYRFLFR
jgi:hypothetical protein